LSLLQSPSWPKWRFETKILIPVVGITIVALAMGALTMLWTARQSDAFAVDRQVQSAKRAISATVDMVSVQQQTIAISDAALADLAKPAPTWSWIGADVGIWLHQIFSHDRVYILGPHVEPLYAMVDGDRVAAERFYDVHNSIRSVVLKVYDPAYTSAHSASYPLQRQSTAPRIAVPDLIERNAHLLEVDGRPAAVSAMRITSSPKGERPDTTTRHVIVSVRFLDKALLNALSQRYLIDSPRFSLSSAANPDEIVLPLPVEDTAGPPIHLIWRPERPGSTIVGIVGPVALIALAAVALLTTFLVSRLRRSIAELREIEAQSHQLAYHDFLTGLPNRTMLQNDLQSALDRSAHGAKIAILALNLNRFKQVNDTHGHVAGDKLICEFASRLSRITGPSDVIARLSGDEFVIVQDAIRDRNDVKDLCARILEITSQPFDIVGNKVFVGVSIGVVLAPDHGTDCTDLMRKADIALYYAKSEGGGYRFFAHKMEDTIRHRASLEDELRSALLHGTGLSVHFQPEVSGDGYGIVGLETLVRWNHPARGVVPPDQFIPIAEETGLIVPLGEWVLQKACEMSRRWPHLTIAVNLSAVQFTTAGFPERVIEIVRQSGADSRRIELEITETVLLAGHQAVQTLQTLRAAGYRIALDDFGTGHSSLSYLRQYEVDKIKIDRSFVTHLGQASSIDARAIVNAIVTLGHALGLTVTAEGVETEDQKEFLSKVGCDELQGYLFSRPLPEEEIAALISTDNPARRLPSGLYRSAQPIATPV